MQDSYLILLFHSILSTFYTHTSPFDHQSHTPFFRKPAELHKTYPNSNPLHLPEQPQLHYKHHPSSIPSPWCCWWSWSWRTSRPEFRCCSAWLGGPCCLLPCSAGRSPWLRCRMSFCAGQTDPASGRRGCTVTSCHPQTLSVPRNQTEASTKCFYVIYNHAQWHL